MIYVQCHFYLSEANGLAVVGFTAGNRVIVVSLVLAAGFIAPVTNALTPDVGTVVRGDGRISAGGAGRLGRVSSSLTSESDEVAYSICFALVICGRLSSCLGFAELGR